MKRNRNIHFSEQTLEELKELINILGVEGYGDIPKALKFSVTFTLQELKNQTIVTPDMNDADIDMWFSSIKKLRAKEKQEEIIEKAEKSMKT